MSQSSASQSIPLGDPDHAIDLALFGALGDLAMRKLFPALYHLDREGLMPESTRIMGLARQEHDVAEFRELVNLALQKRLKKDEQDAESLKRFLNRLDYRQLDFTKVDGFEAIRQWREGSSQPMVVYLSVAARIYGDICRNLQASNSVSENSRIIVEKPIGYDLQSSIEINDAIGDVFPESRIYRIDHYLGKETVQNLIALRFANPLF
ncbi:MAG: glucose-6-phosphate dehydrogenase, partial [Halomonas sp.]